MNTIINKNNETESKDNVKFQKIRWILNILYKNLTDTNNSW